MNEFDATPKVKYVLFIYEDNEWHWRPARDTPEAVRKIADDAIAAGWIKPEHAKIYKVTEMYEEIE